MISKNSWKSILIQSYLFYSLPDPRSFISLFIYSLLGSNPKARNTTFKFLAQIVPEPWTSKKSKAFLIQFFWDSVRTCWLCIILFRLRTGAGVIEVEFFILDILIMSFTIKTISAVLTHDTQGLLDDMDPYCVLIIGTKKEKGNVAEDGGKKPVFNDTFTFKETDGDLLNIQVWDYDHLSQDDLIGSGALSLSSYKSTPGQQVVEWVELTYKGKGAGRLRISITYAPKTYMAGPTAPTVAYQYPQQAGYGNPFVTPTYPPGYPQPTYQPQFYPQQVMPGYPQQTMPVYPQQTMPVYPQQMMPGYPQQTMPGYPQQTMPGYPQQTMPGYPYPQYPPQ